MWIKLHQPSRITSINHMKGEENGFLNPHANKEQRDPSKA